jgi:Holliday junction resolvase RusA-like endonuclease
MIEASNRLKPWRATLVEEAREAVLEQGWQRLVDTPIRLTLTFTMTPSQKDALSILKRPGAYPAWRMPDLDKLVRAVGDALTQAETVWDDDSRVTNLLARKGYAGAEGFMRQPGVVIELREQRV